MSNYWTKAQTLISKNESEVKRAGDDVFETARGKDLLETIRLIRPKLNYLAEITIMLKVRKAYKSAIDTTTGEKISQDLEKVCDEAIKAEKLNPVHLLKRLFAA